MLSADEAECRQLVPRYDCHVLPINLYSAIQLPHRLFVETPAQERQRRDRRGFLAVETR